MCNHSTNPGQTSIPATPAPSRCCCCVEKLTLDEWKRIIPTAYQNDPDLQMVLGGASEPMEQRPPTYDNWKRFGHKLKVSFELAYQQSSSDSDCIFEWNEVQNVSVTGWPAGTTKNLVQARPNQFPDWLKHLQGRQQAVQQGKPCLTQAVSIFDEDEPTIVVNPGDNGIRTLTITVTIRSSCPSCVCSNQQLQVVIEQRLHVFNGKPDFVFSTLSYH